MRVLYYIGENINTHTIMKKGIINTNSYPLKLEAEDVVSFDGIYDVRYYHQNGIATMVKVKNRKDTIYLIVPRIYLNVGTGFVVVNTIATRKLKELLESVR